MLSKSKIAISITIFLIGLLICGCTASKAPTNWLSPAPKMQEESYGGWIYIEYIEPAQTSPAKITGEFIALNDTAICVQTQNDGILFIPANSIMRATLETFDNNYRSLSLWTLIGALSTASHGWAATISAPIWIIIGTIVTANASDEGIYTQKYPDMVWWESLTQYARFPQGLPDGINLINLKLKK
ncbi:MAG: hypothetical protein HZB59_08605 [Ignavibacteriales bacterium]|nr:hypothetical protein [Ignavibacteriales bacterium]